MTVRCTLRTAYRNGSECPSDAAYWVHGVECHVCMILGDWAECRGHEVCVDHAAELRTTAVRQKPAHVNSDLPPFVVARCYSLRTSPAPS